VASAVIAGGLVTFSTNRPIPAAAGTLGEARTTSDSTHPSHAKAHLLVYAWFG
jgi:hypothetical protein